MPESITVLNGNYAISRLAPGTEVPSWVSGEFTSVTHTADEISIVCLETNVPVNVQADREWTVLKIEGPLSLEETGILSSLLKPLADARIPVFTVSTFDTDYILVGSGDAHRAVAALTASGHTLR
jgi:hypothetical protein